MPSDGIAPTKKFVDTLLYIPHMISKQFIPTINHKKHGTQENISHLQSLESS